jgi:hypothetical protein
MPEAPQPETGALRQDQAQAEIEKLLAVEEGDVVTEAEEKPAKTTPDPKPEGGDEPEEEQEEVEEEEQEEEPTDPEQQEEPTERVFTVKVDGETLQVTESELLKGYSREAHFTRKMQTLAKERDGFEPEMQAVRAERQQLAAVLEQVVARLEPPAEDWEALRASDPVEFQARWSDHQYQLAQQAKVGAELQQVRQRIALDEQKQYAEHLVSQQKLLLETLPELKEEKALTQLLEYGRNVGFQDAELVRVNDHRALVILEKARRWDDSQKTQKTHKAEIQKKIEKAKKTVRPGSSDVDATRVTSELTRSKQRLVKTGRREDAARTIELMLEAEEAAA